MSKYIEVNSKNLEDFLISKGFKRNVVHSEVVYERRHLDNPDVVIRVYTSIQDGAASARGCGKDAIRVSAFLEGADKTYGLFKAARVYRVTSEEEVMKRLEARMRDAYRRCNQWIISKGGKVSKMTPERVAEEIEKAKRENSKLTFNLERTMINAST